MKVFNVLILFLLIKSALTAESEANAYNILELSNNIKKQFDFNIGVMIGDTLNLPQTNKSVITSTWTEFGSRCYGLQFKEGEWDITTVLSVIYSVFNDKEQYNVLVDESDKELFIYHRKQFSSPLIRPKVNFKMSGSRLEVVKKLLKRISPYFCVVNKVKAEDKKVLDMFVEINENNVPPYSLLLSLLADKKLFWHLRDDYLYITSSSQKSLPMINSSSPLEKEKSLKVRKDYAELKRLRELSKQATKKNKKTSSKMR